RRPASSSESENTNDERTRMNTNKISDRDHLGKTHNRLPPKSQLQELNKTRLSSSLTSFYRRFGFLGLCPPLIMVLVFARISIWPCLLGMFFCCWTFWIWWRILRVTVDVWMTESGLVLDREGETELVAFRDLISVAIVEGVKRPP